MEKHLTWNEMYDYLINQENCTIHYKEYKVLNLHRTIRNYNRAIKHYKPEERSANICCKTLKGQLEKMYNLHKQNKFDQIEL